MRRDNNWTYLGVLFNWSGRLKVVIRDCFTRRLVQKGFQVLFKSKIKTRGGLRKPDIIVHKENCGFVLDAQVIGKQYDLAQAHRNKISYYDQEDITNYFKSKLPGNGVVTLSSITLSWKGIWSSDSVVYLQRLGLNNNDFKIISSRMIVGGIAGFHMFNRTTRTN